MIYCIYFFEVFILKKYFALLLIFALGFSFLPVWRENCADGSLVFDYISLESKDFLLEMPQNGAKCAVVADIKSGKLLFAKNPDERRGMASTTKIMTALVAIENCNLAKEFTVCKEAVGIEGSSVYLQEGEKLTLEELLYCLLLESGNDAAVAVAICIGGTEENFVKLMNERARELGLKNTRFTNPHGLSDENHYTTARELAVITVEAMKYPAFAKIVATKYRKVRYNNKENGRLLCNHNKLLSGYKNCIGVKTGYTQKDGKCLVSAAEKDGLGVVAVTLGDPSPTYTHIELLDGAFNKFCMVTVAEKEDINLQIPIENGERDFVTAVNFKEIKLCLPKGTKYTVDTVMPKAISAPIKRGDIVCRLRVTAEGGQVYIINLEATEDIKVKRKNLWEKIFG